MSDTIQMVLAGLLAVMYGLWWLAPRFPDVRWLQAFRDAFPRPDEAQRAKMRRRANVYAGAQLILMGLALPLGYGALTVMTFSAFTTKELVLVLAGSVLCIGLGITAMWRSGRG